MDVCACLKACDSPPSNLSMSNPSDRPMDQTFPLSQPASFPERIAGQQKTNLPGRIAGQQQTNPKNNISKTIHHTSSNCNPILTLFLGWFHVTILPWPKKSPSLFCRFFTEGDGRGLPEADTFDTFDLQVGISAKMRVFSRIFAYELHLGLSPLPGCQAPPGLWNIFGGGIPINLHLPQLLGGGTTQVTPQKSNSSHLKIGRNPRGNDRIPTIHFQVPC